MGLAVKYGGLKHVLLDLNSSRLPLANGELSKTHDKLFMLFTYCLLSYSCFSLSLAEVWIGLNDIQIEGQWNWVSDNTSISTSYWQSTEPNGGRAENCVNYCKKMCGKNAYGWNDLHCDYPIGYVCEKQL